MLICDLEIVGTAMREDGEEGSWVPSFSYPISFSPSPLSLSYLLLVQISSVCRRSGVFACLFEKFFPFRLYSLHRIALKHGIPISRFLILIQIQIHKYFLAAFATLCLNTGLLITSPLPTGKNGFMMVFTHAS